MMTAIIAWCAFIIGFFVGVFWAARSDDLNDPGSGIDGKDT